MVDSGRTKARVLHWFVRGGVLKLDGKEVASLDVDPVVVGRGEGAQVVLADPEVSAFHCELRAVDDGIAVRDLGSTNGTFVGTLRIRDAVVTAPTEIQVGKARFTLEPAAKRR